MSGQTNITYGGAIRAALDHIIADQGRGDVGAGRRQARWRHAGFGGSVGQASGQGVRRPPNEPLIVGTTMVLHVGLHALPEIQFGDYSLNAFHWLVHMGNLYWTSNEDNRFSMILRTPTDPFGGGAVYHSMSIDGYFTPIPGLVVVMPSTSWDVYGLLMTAAEYRSPWSSSSPSGCIDRPSGPAFPGEPTDPQSCPEEERSCGRHPRHRPGAAGAHRQGRNPASGQDVTIVAWGRAVWTAMNAAATRASPASTLKSSTCAHWSRPTSIPSTKVCSVRVTSSLPKTAPLPALCAPSRVTWWTASGMPTRALGQKNVPGIAQCLKLEEATILTADDIVRAAGEVRAGGEHRDRCRWLALDSASVLRELISHRHVRGAGLAVHPTHPDWFQAAAIRVFSILASLVVSKCAGYCGSPVSHRGCPAGPAFGGIRGYGRPLGDWWWFIAIVCSGLRIA